MTMSLDDETWELLNGYADGELSPEEMAAMETRISNEPELADALARILAVKSSLGALRPEATQIAAPPRRGWEGWRWPAAAAAVLLAAAVGLGATMMTWQQVAPGDVAALHAELANETYVVDLERRVTLSAGASIGDLRAPDLSATNLTLVDVRTFEPSQRIAMHYRGRQGCRVTFFVDAIESEPFGPSTEALLHHRWTTKTRRFVLVADGMDENRFAAIGAFAEAASHRSEALETFRTALVARTQEARPCA